MDLVGGACIQNSDSEETGQGQTINSYTNKPINKFKVHALLDDTLSCTHRVRVGPGQGCQVRLRPNPNHLLSSMWSQIGQKGGTCQSLFDGIEGSNCILRTVEIDLWLGRRLCRICMSSAV